MNRPLYALHGFFGMPSDWDFLGNGVEKVNLFEKIPIPYWEWAAQFNSTVSQSSFLLGYSLGGRLALHALLQDPSKWVGAIIVSAHPGLESLDEKRKRRTADHIWADRFLQEPWEMVIKAWSEQDVLKNAKEIGLRQERDFSRDYLAKSLSFWSLGVQDTLLEPLSHLDIPILWLTGAQDVKFTALAQKIKLHHPLSRIESVAETSHRVPWECPEKFEQSLRAFIGSVEAILT